VAGSAVFPTSGHANSTLTIMALSKRLATHLRSRLPVTTQRERNCMNDPYFEGDLASYPHRPLLKEQSIRAIWVYRFGRRVLESKPGLARNVKLKLYWLAYRIIETVRGVGLALEAEIGPGLRIHHFGNVFVIPQVVLGRNCTLRQGITLET
jgi:serine O-acetyltransferase